MNKNKILTIPNILSLLRLTTIPFILWAYLIGKKYLSSLLIIISAITDVLDGFIARKYKMISALGKALDPIADKLTIGIILLTLSIKNAMIIPLLIIFTIKEIIMGFEGLLIIKYTGTTYSAKWYGKLSTVVLYLTMLSFILFKNIPKDIMLLNIITCTIIVIISFIMYTLSNCINIVKYKKLKTSINNDA